MGQGWLRLVSLVERLSHHQGLSKALTLPPPSPYLQLLIYKVRHLKLSSKFISAAVISHVHGGFYANLEVCSLVRRRGPWPLFRSQNGRQDYRM